MYTKGLAELGESAGGRDVSADAAAVVANAGAKPGAKPGDAKQVDAKRIDAFAFARLGKEAQGSVPLVRFTRLVDGLPEQPAGEAGLVYWSVRGEEGKSGLLAGLPLLHLHVQANPVVVCQRCNVPFAYPVDSEVLLQLVKSEDDLDDGFASGEHSGGIEDEDDEDEEGKGFVSSLPEKVVGSHHFDLLAQIEDELILSVPYVPKHDVCPGAQANAGEASPEEPAVKRPSPFAVLEQLKHKD
ncbi:Large ribosomal RNA subunit accumulation protein YceD [compost metagenome]